MDKPSARSSEQAAASQASGIRRLAWEQKAPGFRVLRLGGLSTRDAQPSEGDKVPSRIPVERRPRILESGSATPAQMPRSEPSIAEG